MRFWLLECQRVVSVSAAKSSSRATGGLLAIPGDAGRAAGDGGASAVLSYPGCAFR